MERFELDPKLKEEIRARVLGDGFMKIVQTVRRNGKTFRISMRPVEIGGERKFQAEMVDDGQVQVKNLAVDAAAEGLDEIINQRGAREMHLMTAKGDLHLRVTKKGHALVSRSAEMDRTVVVQPHDRVKKLPLTSFDSTALLRTIGIADGEGRVRASMRGKYDQVNEFLKVVGETVGRNNRIIECSNNRMEKGDPSTANSTIRQIDYSKNSFTVVDCGCGKAYLTISMWYYLTFVLGYANVRVIGIDRRSDVIESARRMAAQLDLADKVVFHEADLTTFELPCEKVDLVCSLHACDTATDEALARGVEWKARYILSAPCCQHELQKVLGNNRIIECSNNRMGEKEPSTSNSTIRQIDYSIIHSKNPSCDVFSGLMRQSILRERLCDILTDSFRAMILRILGFKTQVIEFVSSEATARNIMLKCEYGVKAGQPGPVGEYLSLRDFWHVTPWLETRLEPLLGKHLRRYE
jgi:hypothetical protein